MENEIRLDQFLKWSRTVSTGGQSKYLILNNKVKVNGVLENHRSRKLKHGDKVEIENMGSFRVVANREGS
ncbi:RNA-binding S4 domain-containing protein [Desulfotruncus arcticus]|uniref:RNA-binding S4 domain-containing protein n=1 Tax=Desulfotruncus arcticus TaxID=341036 RepID=UPI00307FAC41